MLWNLQKPTETYLLLLVIKKWGIVLVKGWKVSHLYIATCTRTICTCLHGHALLFCLTSNCQNEWWTCTYCEHASTLPWHFLKFLSPICLTLPHLSSLRRCPPPSKSCVPQHTEIIGNNKGEQGPNDELLGPRYVFLFFFDICHN